MKSRKAAERREFLKTTGVLTGILAVGGQFALLAPTRSWALDLHAFTSEQGAALLAAARTIAPHDALEDAAYAAVVHAADADALRDAPLRTSLTEGVAALGAGFARASEPERVAALKRIEAGEFFQRYRARTLGVLYSTPLAQAFLGYEGEAFTKGGYLLRGFNDLRWLPDVPEANAGPTLKSGA